MREITEANWFAEDPMADAAIDSFEDIGLRTHARAALSQRLAALGRSNCHRRAGGSRARRCDLDDRRRQLARLEAARSAHRVEARRPARARADAPELGGRGRSAANDRRLLRAAWETCDEQPCSIPSKSLRSDEAADGALSRLLRLASAPRCFRQRWRSLPTVLPDADLLIDRIGTERLADAGWPQSRLREEYPRLIHVSVTPFGSGGPYGRWHGSELVASAMGGTLRVTGEPDRPPVKEALDACGFHADLVAASGAMAALYERGESGLGQHIDVSVQEVAFSRNVNGVLVWQFDKRKLEPRRRRAQLRSGHGSLHLAAGGWLLLSFAHDRPLRRARQSGTQRLDG